MAPLGHQNSILFINKRLFQQTNATNETKMLESKSQKLKFTVTLRNQTTMSPQEVWKSLIFFYSYRMNDCQKVLLS